jgi:hypothetical protein
MSKVIKLLCNRFGGIREHNAFFTSDIVTAQDIQNVELYHTGLNNGVGIRTVKGNSSINDDLVGTAKIIKIFESMQQQATYFFVYAEDLQEGYFYLYNTVSSELTLLKDGLTPTHNANGFDISQGWSDIFFFTNGVEMFTVEIGITRTLYAYVYDTHTIYADSPTTPTKLYDEDGWLYSGEDWEISESTVQYSGNDATYTVANNIVLPNTILDMELVDKDGRPVVGLNAAVFDNRLWIASNNVLWYSVQADIYDFATHDAQVVTSSGYIELLKNITAIHEYLGTLAVFFADSSLLVAADSSGVFSIGDDSPGGCAGYDSLVFHDTDLFFYDDTKKSVFSFKQVINGEKTLGQNVATEVQNIFKKIDTTKLNNIQAYSVFLEGRNEIWWVLPIAETYDYPKTIYAYVYDTHIIYADSSTSPTKLYNSDGTEYTGADWIISSSVIKYGDNDATYTASSNKKVTAQKAASIILIYDYLKGEWIKRKSQKINSIAVINNKLYSAGDDGNILEEYVTDSFNGDYIPHYYNCSPCNLGANNTLKILVFSPRVTFSMPYNNQFYVKYVKNFDIYKSPKIKFVKSKLKNFLYWDVGYWDKSYWPPKSTSAVGKLPSATFKVLELSFFSNDVSQTFSIKNLEFSKIKIKQV